MSRNAPAIAAIVVLWAPFLAAADRISIGTNSANAGTAGVAVDVQVTNDTPIHAFSLALGYDPAIMVLRQISDQGTLSAVLGAEFFFPRIDNVNGAAVLGVIFSYNDDPFARVELGASPDTPQRVAVLRFDLNPDAPPGLYPVLLLEQAGSPPIGNVFSREGRSIYPTLEPGSVRVNNENVFMLDSVEAQPGSSFEVKASAKHPDTLQGFAVALTFDKRVLTFLDATYAGTQAALLIRPQVIEFFNPEIDANFSISHARVSVGALLDRVPPFTGHEIPASADEFQSLTRFVFTSPDDPSMIGACSDLTLHDSDIVGKTNNIVIVDRESLSPDLVHGRVCFSDAPTFRRGYVNEDTRINIADGVTMLGYQFLGEDPPTCLLAGDVNDDNRFDLSDAVGLFHFLFLGGEEPKEPYLTCGHDPTPTTRLTCNHAPQCQ